MNTKEVTLSEFRAWLEGVEELQPAKWSPNATQWKLIRRKIDLITVVPPQTIVQRVPQYVRDPQQERVRASSLPEEPEVIPTIPADPNLVAKHVQPTVGGIKTVGGRIVTPNIDTSDGSFRSGFE